jgi:DNA-binding NarL/FixJ family response regulator
VTRPRVLLAENHASMARQLRALLDSCCDVVKVVEDGSALLAAAAAHQPDVIVTDIGMPRLSGLEAARIILADNPQARIVLVTIRDDPSVVRAALHSGVLAYVLKVDAGDELVDAVRAAIAGQRYLSTNARAALN